MPTGKHSVYIRISEQESQNNSFPSLPKFLEAQLDNKANSHGTILNFRLENLETHTPIEPAQSPLHLPWLDLPMRHTFTESGDISKSG